MEYHSELAIILKTFSYQERDRIVVFFTENHGKLTGIAKGGINSKRFGGALDFLACSKVSYVEKANSEMVRIDEALIHHEFQALAQDFERLAAASFGAEFCLKLLESQHPLREMFVILSNYLFQLNGGAHIDIVVNAFLCKAFQAMGYQPSLFRCVRCGQAAHEVLQKHANEKCIFWNFEAGGVVCIDCEPRENAKNLPLESELLLDYHYFTVTPFKVLASQHSATQSRLKKLFKVLSDFLHHHVPGLQGAGLNSWKILNQTMEKL